MNRSQLRSLTAGLALALALAAAGCGEPPAPGSDWPVGTLVVARTEALAQLLARLQRLDGTRVARRAAALAETLPDCEWLEGHVENGPPAEVWSRLTCRAGAGELAGLEGERGERDIAFALPADGGARTLGTLSVAANGDVDAEILLPRSAFADARALMLPARGAPGPPLLSHADELVHARLRPEGGLDIAALVPESSQADRLFRLKSELFAGAVLDGTWEAAIYLPEPGRPMPRSALAVGFSLKDPAVAAMERFISDLQASWPVRRSDFAVAGARGACLLDLNIMPDLAPCYVATEAALVIGWNPASLRKALAADRAAADIHPQAGLSVDLERFPEADARFAQLACLAERAGDPAAEPERTCAPERPESPARTDTHPWRRLTADGAREGDSVRVRVALRGRAGA